MDFKTELEKLTAELTNHVNERNFCLQKAEQLGAQINYVSGKIDILKQLSEDPNDKIQKTADSK
jgi:hypothetical protein